MTPLYGVAQDFFLFLKYRADPTEANADEVLEQFERTQSCWTDPCVFSL
jgi:hypothetical protein